MQSRGLLHVLVLTAMTLISLIVPGKRLQAQPPPTPANRVQAQTLSPQPTLSPALTLLPQPGLTLLGVGSGRFEMRDIEPGRTPGLECAVTLKNTTSQPISIGSVRGSCGCETVRLVKDGREVLQVDLLPGEQAVLHVTVRISSMSQGETHKFVWAYAPNSLKPLATLEVVFSLRTPVLFTPSVLNFGKIDSSSGAALPLTVRMEASLTEDGILPHLVSSNSDIIVVKEGSPQSIQRDGKAWLEQKYRVQVSPHANPGSLYGSLRFDIAFPSLQASSSAIGTRTASGGDLSTVSMAHLTMLSPALRVPFAGEVVGGLAFTPKAVYLGTVTVGKDASRQVVLSGLAGENLKKLIVTTTSPWLSAAPAVNNSTNHNATSAGQILDITLNPHTPAGFLQAQVIVTTANGEKAILPVIVEVTAPH